MTATVCSVVSTGLELMSIYPRPHPAEVETRVRLDFAAASASSWLMNKFLHAGARAFLKPKVAVFATAASLAFQAPPAFLPFLLLAVSFLPIHLDLEHSE